VSSTITEELAIFAHPDAVNKDIKFVLKSALTTITEL